MGCSLLTTSLKGEAGVERNAHYSEVTSTERVPLGTRWGRSGSRRGTRAGSRQGLLPHPAPAHTPHPALRGGLSPGPSQKAGPALEKRGEPTLLHSLLVRGQFTWTAGARLGLHTVQSFYLHEGGGTGLCRKKACGAPADTANPNPPRNKLLENKAQRNRGQKWGSW